MQKKGKQIYVDERKIESKKKKEAGWRGRGKGGEHKYIAQMEQDS